MLGLQRLIADTGSTNARQETPECEILLVHNYVIIEICGEGVMKKALMFICLFGCQSAKIEKVEIEGTDLIIISNADVIPNNATKFLFRENRGIIYESPLFCEQLVASS